MFRWLKSKAKPVSAPSLEVAPVIVNEMADVFESPSKLAKWFQDSVLDQLPWRDNLSMLPNEAALVNLEITFEQRERLAKEHSVLRVVGALVMSRLYFGNVHYQSLLSDLTSRTANAMELADGMRYELGQALDEYARNFTDLEMEKVARSYVRRLYDDNPNYLRILNGGIGNLAVRTILGSYDAMREALQSCKPGFTTREADGTEAGLAVIRNALAQGKL